MVAREPSAACSPCRCRLRAFPCVWANNRLVCAPADTAAIHNLTGIIVPSMWEYQRFPAAIWLLPLAACRPPLRLERRKRSQGRLSSSAASDVSSPLSVNNRQRASSSPAETFCWSRSISFSLHVSWVSLVLVSSEDDSWISQVWPPPADTARRYDQHCV